MAPRDINSVKIGMAMLASLDSLALDQIAALLAQSSWKSVLMLSQSSASMHQWAQKSNRVWDIINRDCGFQGEAEPFMLFRECMSARVAVSERLGRLRSCMPSINVNRHATAGEDKREQERRSRAIDVEEKR